MLITCFSRKSRGLRKREQGYVLLTMLLAVSLMTIAALAALPDMIFELKRDQEQEMIHRGVQYTRAIRIYYRKFGRYPTSLADLDNTNNLRYLRKHYKDPLTGKDFKLLHFGDPGLQLGGGLSAPTLSGATPAGAMNGANPSNGTSFGNSFGSSNASSFGGGSSFGNSFGGSSFGNSGSSFGNNGVNTSGVFSQTSSFGGNSNPGSVPNANPQSSSSQGTNSSESALSPASPANTQGDAGSSEQQVVAGGPIVGVASLCKKKTIRIYNHKTKYDEWQFIYDPTADRGGLITTPYQSALQAFGSQPLQPAQNNSQTGSSNSFGNSFGQSSGFGQSSFGGSSFGQSSGFGNNSNSGGSNSSNPPQQ